MIVVSDTTPLNYLVLSVRPMCYPRCWGPVYAPSAVIKELWQGEAAEAVQSWASEPPSWLSVQDPAHANSALKLGPGEAAGDGIGRGVEGGLDTVGSA